MQVEPPRMVQGLGDADSWPGDYEGGVVRDGWRPQEQSFAQSGATKCQPNPERLGEFARTTTEIAWFGGSPAADHYIEAYGGFECSEQNRLSLPCPAGDNVHTSVDAVAEVDVHLAAGFKHRGGAFGGAAEGVAGWVFQAVVGLAFNDAAAGFEAVYS